MENLSFFKAVVQILKAIKFASPVSVEQRYSLDIKTVRPFENSVEDDNLLFHFKLNSSCEISSKDILESDEMDELIKIVHKMQSIEEESHLCIQEVNPENPQKILQKGYTVESNKSNTLKFKESWVKEKKRKNNQGVMIHLRIYQLKHSMMKDYSKICQYIKLLKVFNPQMMFSSSMVVEDNMCINEYRYSYTSVIGTEIQIGSNTEYYMNSLMRPIYPRIYPFSGESVILPNTDIGCGLHAVFRMQVVSFQVTYRSTEMNPHSHAFMILFGPDGIPIYPCSSTCGPYNILSELPWNNYQFKSFSQRSTDECCLCRKWCKESLHPQYDVSLVPVWRQDFQQSIYVMTIVVLADECNTTVMKKRRFVSLNSTAGALEWLSCNWYRFIQNNKDNLQKAVISSLDKTMNTKSKCSNENLYNKAINDITASVSSIIMRSTNENFRGKCFELLQVNSARCAEQKLKHKLQAIARSQGLVSDDEKCRETFEESDQNQEISNNMYYSHTSDDLCNASSVHKELNEVITNDIIDTDLSEAEIIKSFEINEKCMTQVDYSQNTNDIDLENMYSVNDDHSVETEIPIHQHSDNMLDIEEDTMMSISVSFGEDEKNVTESSKILERDGEEKFVFHINSTVTSALNDDIQHNCNKDILDANQHSDKNTGLHVTGNVKTVVTEDSEEWFNDVLHDVDDWLLAL